jgi:hypothetical protein
MSLQKNAGAVRRFAKAMKFGAWLQALPAKLTPPPFRLMQIGSAFWQSRALHVAVRLDLAGALGDEELTAAAIAARVGADADALGRLLRLLAALGIFEETAAGSFRNNKLSAYLRGDHPHNVRAMILLHNAPAMSQPWYEQLERGVRQGLPPFELAHGEDLFAYLDRHADFDRLFSEAMDSVEALVGDSFASDFDWGRFRRVIDVGGSRGSKALAILRRHPRLEALVIDRPQVIAEAEQYWAGRHDAGSERLRFQTGDLLAGLPPAQGDGDIYLLSAVLHGFDDATCITALRNLASACGGSGARIAVLEMVLPESGADVAAASFDLQMWMASRGRERTLGEWSALFARSGVVLEEVVGLRSLAKILVLRPAPAG